MTFCSSITQRSSSLAQVCIVFLISAVCPLKTVFLGAAYCQIFDSIYRQLPFPSLATAIFQERS
jgi:hypothetical protein